jgi:hypothetical protein
MIPECMFRAASHEVGLVPAPCMHREFRPAISPSRVGAAAALA